MSDDLPDRAGTASSRWKLEECERLLADVLVALGDVLGRVSSGDERAVAELPKLRIAVISARAQLLEEVTKHEKRVLVAEGSAADAPLDFDDIRRSIGERLDRIRDAQREDGLS